MITNAKHKDTPSIVHDDITTVIPAADSGHNSFRGSASL